ncbi:MAG TPA: hypothetical protein VNW92_00335 [Polyangiaceae bacterium]|jgi:hypothetical protein|nr:hypothetical protein [Polyangiaceae bacterium]
MTRTSPLAAAALLGLLVFTHRAGAQATAPANPNSPAAVRAARIKAAQAAAAAAAKAQPTAPPVVTPPPPPVVTTPPVATAAPKATATAPAATGSAKPATSGSAAPVAAVAHPDTAAIGLDLDALKKTRPERRHAEFTDLQTRFGSLLADPRATAELKQHGQRIAYLQRIRALGVKANDANFVKGVDALITTEETRDANALNALRTSALPAAAPAAATAVAVPVAGGSK